MDHLYTPLPNLLYDRDQLKIYAFQEIEWKEFYIPEWEQWEDYDRNNKYYYNTIGDQLDAEVCPVGRAMELALDIDPEIELYSNDGSHSNINGTYLAVCMFYYCLFGESPSGIEYVIDNAISNEDRDFLQMVADETINLYFYD